MDICRNYVNLWGWYEDAQLPPVTCLLLTQPRPCSAVGGPGLELWTSRQYRVMSEDMLTFHSTLTFEGGQNETLSRVSVHELLHCFY